MVILDTYTPKWVQSYKGKDAEWLRGFWVASSGAFGGLLAASIVDAAVIPDYFPPDPWVGHWLFPLVAVTLGITHSVARRVVGERHVLVRDPSQYMQQIRSVYNSLPRDGTVRESAYPVVLKAARAENEKDLAVAAQCLTALKTYRDAIETRRQAEALPSGDAIDPITRLKNEANLYNEVTRDTYGQS